MQGINDNRLVDNTRQQMQLQQDFGIPKELEDKVKVVFVVNDDLAEKVINVANAERTTSGTTALFTAPGAVVSPISTWISAITLTISEGITNAV